MKTKLDHYTRTNDFRWLMVNSKNTGGPPEYHILQQRWCSAYYGEPDQWRDIPTIAEEDTK